MIHYQVEQSWYSQARQTIQESQLVLFPLRELGEAGFTRTRPPTAPLLGRLLNASPRLNTPRSDAAFIPPAVFANTRACAAPVVVSRILLGVRVSSLCRAARCRCRRNDVFPVCIRDAWEPRAHCAAVLRVSYARDRMVDGGRRDRKDPGEQVVKQSVDCITNSAATINRGPGLLGHPKHVLEGQISGQSRPQYFA